MYINYKYHCNSIRTSTPRTNTTNNTSTYNVANHHPNSTSDIFYTISQLVTFGLWKRVDLLPHTLGRSCDYNPTPSCDPPARDGRSTVHITSYPRWFLGYTSVWIVSVSDMRSKPPRSIVRMACVSLQPLSSQMLSVPMASLGGRGSHQCNSGGAMSKDLS